MKEILEFKHWSSQLSNCNNLLIAGPCSAESEEQVLDIAKELAKLKYIKVFRSGVWKPRTQPGEFQGVGTIALEWLKEVKKRTGLLTCVEVANSQHVEECLKNDVDILWIGARTTVNPFYVQEIADALKNVDIPVLVKNPVVPDLKLWIGAIERLYKAGLRKLAAVHRGFYPFEESKYRNIPKWELIIDLKTQFPYLPVIIDPSHIAGKRELVEDVLQKGSCLGLDGYMIEVHTNPDKALSDAKQQITPERLKELLEKLNISCYHQHNQSNIDELNKFRQMIDSLDYQLLELLAKRMNVVAEIAKYKIENDMDIFQIERWREIVKTRLVSAKDLNLDSEFVKKLLQIIHFQSIDIQTKVKYDKNN